MHRIAILGSTGSIGTQTLEVIDHLSDCCVTALGAGTNVERLEQQVRRYAPKQVSLQDASQAQAFAAHTGIPVVSGVEGMCELAVHPEVDTVVAAVVGAAGIRPVIAALEAGKRVALANKEVLVAAGSLLTPYQDQLIPIDSEHSALWQCLEGRDLRTVARLILTASGGPFHGRTDDLSAVRPSQALAHPNWSMGGKITIDSATLMNKGFEIIEAHWLFRFSYDTIDVIIHPQSIIHSCIQLCDGAVIAQMAPADMRLPIQYALTYPHVKPALVSPLDLAHIDALSFAAPDRKRFPCLELAYSAGRTGGTMPAVLNAANEVAVAHFLKEGIAFTDIPAVIEQTMAQHGVEAAPDLEAVLAADAEGRARARELARAKRRG